jgi:hypothetical protein
MLPSAATLTCVPSAKNGFFKYPSAMHAPDMIGEIVLLVIMPI